jgi:hypothetical protein
LGRNLWWPASSDDSSRPATAQKSAGQATNQSEPLPSFQRGILFLPYLGLSLPLGVNSGSYAVGHNFGALIGIHLTPGFSISTEINVDYMSPGPLATETQTDYALGPLLQSGNARHVWVLGMKLGAFNIKRSVGGTATNRYSETTGTSYSNSGFVWGVTFGGFVPVGPVALGGLVRITARFLSSNCEEGIDETICNEGERKGISPSLTTFNLSAAALF